VGVFLSSAAGKTAPAAAAQTKTVQSDLFFCPQAIAGH